MIQFDVIATPAGPCTLEVEDGKLIRVHLGLRSIRAARRRKLPLARRWLADWFRGRPVDVPLKFEGTEFTCRVYDVVRRIPAGETRTYAEVARAAGRPGAARAVGNVMANNRLCLFVPCHRVVGASGLGGFSGSGGLAQKRLLLALESRRNR